MSSFAQKKSKTIATRRRTHKRQGGDDSDDDSDGVVPRSITMRPDAEAQICPIKANRAKSPKKKGGLDAGAPSGEKLPPKPPPKVALRPRLASLWLEPLLLPLSDLAETRKGLGVLVRGDDVKLCPRPVVDSSDRALPALFADAMRAFGPPTSVQTQAWPAMLAGIDLHCLAETGSGKTLAYLLPLMAHAHAVGRGKGGSCYPASGGREAEEGNAPVQPKPNSLGAPPVALILAPTRELATQVRLYL
ncbi:P-loop containing nucleoside triphosphate hydrolase protein [Pavlovales sp. CCMP2436]|nr:P-loop containing nucleoside triphosphate hydrolase protein [Pavlovales sp. CCMP2436]